MRDNPFLNTPLLLVDRGAMSVTFGEWLKAQRKSRKLTQEVVAERIGGGFSYVAVGDWERGKRNPRPENLIAVADALAGPTASEEVREAIRRDARLAAAGVLGEEGGIERAINEEAFFGFLESYNGPDARIKAIRGVAELLHEGTAATASRPASMAATLEDTFSRPRETGTLARTLEAYIPSGDFSGLTASDLDQAMAVAFAEAEKMAVREFRNVYDNRFRQEAQMLLSKQGKRLAALDRPVPPPAQKESVLDDVLGGE